MMESPSERPILVSDDAHELRSLAERLGIEGRFVFRIAVRDDGSVGAVQVVETPLDENFFFLGTALGVVRQWRFLPGRQNGRTVHCWITIELDLAANEE